MKTHLLALLQDASVAVLTCFVVHSCRSCLDAWGI